MNHGEESYHHDTSYFFSAMPNNLSSVQYFNQHKHSCHQHERAINAFEPGFCGEDLAANCSDPPNVAVTAKAEYYGGSIPNLGDECASAFGTEGCLKLVLLLWWPP